MSIQEVRACACRATRGWTGVIAFAVVAPTLGVLVARLIQPYAGPAVAAAESPLIGHAVDKFENAQRTHWFRPLRPDERAELEAIASHTVPGLGDTPLTKLPGEPGSAKSRVEIIDDVREINAPSLGVTSIMSTKTQPLAVVGGKLLRVGDEVSPGWAIAAINPETATVIIHHESGFEHTLKLRQ